VENPVGIETSNQARLYVKGKREKGILLSPDKEKTEREEE
jgi:hypothetical protein